MSIITNVSNKINISNIANQAASCLGNFSGRAVNAVKVNPYLTALTLLTLSIITLSLVYIKSSKKSNIKKVPNNTQAPKSILKKGERQRSKSVDFNQARYREFRRDGASADVGDVSSFIQENLKK